MKFTILDIESTGLPPKNAKYETDFMQYPYILSMAWKCFKDGQESETFEYIINQEGRTVPSEATAINGITQEQCDNSKFDTFSTLVQFMMDADGSDFIIGHNIYFDTSLIKANILRIIQGGKTPMDMFNKISDILHKDKRIDTMRAGTKLCGKWPKLTELYMKLFQEEFDAHSAKADVDACYRCFQELLRLNLIKILLPEKVVAEVAQIVVEEEI